MMRFSGIAFGLIATWCLPGPTALAVDVGSLFGPHMVLQQQKPVPVWGWAEPGTSVTVEFAGQSKTARTGGDRRWDVRLEPLAASEEPRELIVRSDDGSALVRIGDVLVGEVWLCGGQSNMERPLGARGGLGVTGQDEAIATANFPQIRQLLVPRAFSLTPKPTADATWSVCSPETATNFSAVGFFFARELWRQRRVPVGIINSSYGGSAAEAWMSLAATKAFPAIQARYEVAQNEPADPAAAWDYFLRHTEAWFQTHDPGTQAGWPQRDVDPADWATMELPGIWEYAGHPAVDGVGWFQKRITVPSDWVGLDLELRLGDVDDGDTTWFNGGLLGSTFAYGESRSYTVPAAIVALGENVITVRVQDFANDGGFHDTPDSLTIAPVGRPAEARSLRGAWRYRISLASLEDVPIPPQEQSRFGIWVPGNLYHAMIAPLVPFAIRGFTFYQGETNTAHAREYQTLFPALIADWRAAWGDETLPFLFVQIAPYRSSRPEFREAQAIAWRRTRHTAMIVTNDCTEADDIHPPDKRPVGERLALAARALAHGENVEYSGPVFRALRVEEHTAVLTFDHLGGGLVVAGGALRGFEIAGRDRVFHPAQAAIVGDEVVVSAAAVPAPRAVRYAWANVPDGNLANRAGLPASSFRSDPDER